MLKILANRAVIISALSGQSFWGLHEFSERWDWLDRLDRVILRRERVWTNRIGRLIIDIHSILFIDWLQLTYIPSWSRGLITVWNEDQNLTAFVFFRMVWCNAIIMLMLVIGLVYFIIMPDLEVGLSNFRFIDNTSTSNQIVFFRLG